MSLLERFSLELQARGRRRVLAYITDPPVVRAILDHLHLPSKPPPIAPARGPPQARFDVDLCG